ncbi:cell division protein ZapE [Thioflexithrix psekupsensis]|uniref:Cell division protein ZapE n=1 Tax=Thioflexithrix psekupsensis TaxID=1570016 RepID=A0A251X7U6_9GAMM|nr:cell division protein ZapE [Thioflexithrix psekupsensis]OUD14010.1 cell division protein ZapE [Thioflexithrix psekupsensis]
MTPLQRYQADLQRSDFSADPAQEQAVRHTQRLFEALAMPQNSVPPPRLLTRLRGRLQRRGDADAVNKIQGLYFWGGVGRGKTYLVDNFYDCLPFAEKQRIHFHRFMQYVHHELRQLKNVQNPLKIISQQWAKKCRIICLDEFHVSDITDAMLLGNLLQALFEQNVTLVATSNVAPDNLYKNGLQRERFLPAIALIKQHTMVVNVDNGVDYRLRALEQAEIYHYPLDNAAQMNMEQAFYHLSPDHGEIGQMLEINGRLLRTVKLGDGIIWFDFTALCDIPRAVPDYIELAQCYNTVLLSNVPQMDEKQDDRALRFINLVDEFYDRNVKLIISAQTPAHELYTGKKQAFQFQRTLSRLQEMQSHDYLKRPHLP